MTSSLEKRIKKHVIGKPHLFEAVAPLGFEQTLADELEFIGVECSSSELSDGKVRFTAKITEAWKAVAHSRIANRVLMEIANFKAENFGQLEKKASEIPWELFFRLQAPGARHEAQDADSSVILSNAKDPQQCHLEHSDAEQLCHPEHSLIINVTCKHSRLYHSDAVAERLRNVICKPEVPGSRFEVPGSKHEAPLATKLFVRLENDRCSIWLDLAGEELYKRGHERYVAEAPLKETIAAAMIFEALKFEVPGSRHEVTGTSPEAQDADSSIILNKPNVPPPDAFLTTNHQPLTTIIDPMAGSGTFSLEAAYIACGLIPGKCRDFALKHQPAFKEASWNYLIKGSRLQAPGSRCEAGAIRIITSDISERPINIIKHNVENSPLPQGIINPQLKDFFSYNLEDFGAQPTIILLNPPYGKRLAFDAPKLYAKIGQKIAEWSQDLHAITIAILVPKDCMASLTKGCPKLLPTNNPNAKIIETSHGGFSLNAIFARV